MKKSVKVFISYSRKDAEFVEKLAQKIQNAGGVDITIDVKSVAFGDNLQDFVDHAVRDTDLTISVVSKHSLESAWVAQEFLETLMYEKVNEKKKLLPIYIDRSLFDNNYCLELLGKIDRNIKDLIEMTGKAAQLGGNSTNYDLQRARLHRLKSQLGDILAHLQSRLAADFSNEQAMAENLPKLLNTIKGKETEQPMLSEPEPIPFVNRKAEFVNRKTEWEKVLVYPEGQYYFFDGSAGYGKTELLRKIHEKFQQAQWLSAYIALQEPMTLRDTLDALKRIWNFDLPAHLVDQRQTGLEIGKTLAAKHQQEHVEGVALLLDLERTPNSNLIQIFNIFVTQIIPGIFDGLIHNSDFFRNTPMRFRVVLAARYLASLINEWNPHYTITLLQPFDYRVSLDICKQYDPETEQQEEFAAHLLFYSGGHPRCMVKILNMYQETKLPPSDFFTYCRNQIEEIALEEANWVHSCIQEKLIPIFDRLCVYRRINHLLLKQFLPEFGWHGDEYDLLLELRRSYLLNWADANRQHLSDDITRRLLVLRRRYGTDSASLTTACKQAEVHCLEQLEFSVEYRAYWAVEALFEYLQSQVQSIKKASERKKLQEQFFTHKLPHILQHLIEGRDPRGEREPLLGVLSADWEFHFTLNYYLRESFYNETPYQRMLEAVDNFFRHHLNNSGGK